MASNIKQTYKDNRQNYQVVDTYNKGEATFGLGLLGGIVVGAFTAWNPAAIFGGFIVGGAVGLCTEKRYSIDAILEHNKEGLHYLPDKSKEKVSPAENVKGNYAKLPLVYLGYNVDKKSKDSKISDKSPEKLENILDDEANASKTEDKAEAPSEYLLAEHSEDYSSATGENTNAESSSQADGSQGSSDGGDTN